MLGPAELCTICPLEGVCVGDQLNGQWGARLGSICGVAKSIFKLMQDINFRTYCFVGTGKWPGGGERGFSRVGWMLPKSLAGVLKTHVLNMHLPNPPNFHIARRCIMQTHTAVFGNRCLAHIPTCVICSTIRSLLSMSIVEQ